MKAYQVRITDDGERDLLDIYSHIAANDSVENAEYVLGKLENLCLSLGAQPSRGHVPPELDAVGVKRYREVHFKPYRAIYEVLGAQVIIYCVVDGRRNLQWLLERRLLR